MIKSIVTNIKDLRKSCELVTKEDDIKSIVQDLKDTLTNFSHKAIGLSANQIGYNKRISYIRIPKDKNPETKMWNYNEYILINAKILEKARPVQVKNESCLSFPGVPVMTKRFVFVTVEYLDENMKIQTKMFQDLEGLCVQHEIDHQNGITIFDRKWRAK